MNPIIPMLAVTGSPRIEKIRYMLEQYKRVGIDTILLYPRSGLEIEYMSEEWRMFCSRVLAMVSELQMKVWLYDEYNWPSGSCKNTVIREDASFRAKRFLYKNGTVSLVEMKPKEEGLIAEPFENDMLNPEAVQCFIRLTHDRYYDWFKQYFGNVIVGIFTDEPSFIYTANGQGIFPFYKGIQEDYQRVTGNVVEDDIKRYCEGHNTEHFPGTYRRLLSDRFCYAYIRQLAEWCRGHGILLTGHTLTDDSPLLATRVTGDWFQFMEYPDVPGVDELQTGFSYVQDRLFSMIENMRYNGKANAMSELFALGPCSMSYTKRRQMLWYAAAYGVNHFFVGISHLDAKGNILKPDFFDNFNCYNPDFDGVRQLAQEAQLAAEFSDKKVLAPIGVRCPYTAYLNALGRRKDRIIEAAYTELIDRLTTMQMPWRVLREEEANTCQIVLDIQEDGIYDEISGQQFSTVETLAAWLDTRYDGPKVLLPDGTPSQEVLLKQYEDGTLLVIERKDIPTTKCDYILCTAEGRKAFTLEPRGVVVFKPGDSSREQQSCVKEIKLEDIRVVPANDNIYRCQFLKDTKTTVRAAEPMTVRMFRRIYPDIGGKVLLDGKEMSFEEICCPELTDCFSELYSKTEVVLEKGVHTIETDITDYAYLPSVLIGGRFSISDNLLKRQDAGKQPVFGRIKVTGNIEIPPDSRQAFLKIDACEMYVVVKINGECMIESAFAPHRILIPEQFYGQKISVELTFFTSLAPLFGDLKTMKEEGIFNPNWVDVPISTPETLDIEKWNPRILVV